MKSVFIYLFLLLLSYSFALTHAQKNNVTINISHIIGHWKLVDTEIVDHVPFLDITPLTSDQMNMVREDSPWDHYTKYDIVFEKDSMYKIHYPIQAFESMGFFVDSSYLHLTTKDAFQKYPVQLKNDTFFLYTPVYSDLGYFKETFVRTNFNDNILNTMKKYGINYPELAGTWMLIREKDYDYGTHYELEFPYSIPDSIIFTKEQMTKALENPKIYLLSTNGIKREYSFWYDQSYIYFKPGKWYKKGDDPMIHFYMK